VLGVHWTRSYREAFALGFQRVREVAAYANNAEVVSDLTAWLEAEPDLTRGVALSRLRILDILAWQVGRCGEGERERCICPEQLLAEKRHQPVCQPVKIPDLTLPHDQHIPPLSP